VQIESLLLLAHETHSQYVLNVSASLEITWSYDPAINILAVTAEASNLHQGCRSSAAAERFSVNLTGWRVASFSFAHHYDPACWASSAAGDATRQIAAGRGSACTPTGDMRDQSTVMLVGELSHSDSMGKRRNVAGRPRCNA